MKLKGLNLKGLSKNVKGITKSAKNLLSGSGGSSCSSAIDDSVIKSKKKYRTQVKKIKDLFPSRKNKHGHKSKSKLESSEEDNDNAAGAYAPGYEPEGDDDESDANTESERPFIKKGSKHRKTKEIRQKNKKSKNADAENDADGEEKPDNTSKSVRKEPRTPNQIGYKYQAVCTMLIILLVTSVMGLMLITIIHLIGARYAWNSLAPSVTTVLIFLGLASCLGIISSLFAIMFRITAIKSRSLRDWYLVITFTVSGIVSLIGFFIVLLQYHDVMDIFGKRFLHLLKSYKKHHHEKLTMDRIQIEFHCCGLYSYEDWFEIENLLDYGVGYVPFSCCSTHSHRPCQHENIARIEELVPEGGDKGILKEYLSIYYIGCKYPMEEYYKTMLDWVIFTLILLTLVQVILLLLLVLIRKASVLGSSSSSAASNKGNTSTHTRKRRK